eukprot:scaffold91329_cov17-Tisochrysis_lutea.AAC.1
MVTFANNPFARWQPAGSIPCAQPTASHIVTDARNTPFAQWQPAGAPIPAAAKNSSLLFSSLSFPSVFSGGGQHAAAAPIPAAAENG